MAPCGDRSQSPGVPGVTPRVFGARRRRTADRAALGRGIDVKKRFLTFFLSWSRFVTFFKRFFLIFQTFFFILKKRWQSSERHAD